MSSFPGTSSVEAIYRNTGENRCVLPACPSCPERCYCRSAVVGPDKSVIKAAKERRWLSTGVCLFYNHDSEWPILLANKY